jgi:hypothetical protein
MKDLYNAFSSSRPRDIFHPGFEQGYQLHAKKFFPTFLCSTTSNQPGLPAQGEGGKRHFG